MSHLYELASEYRALSDKLHDSELDEQTISDTLEGAGGEIEAKATNIGFVVKNIEAEIAAMKQAEEDIAKRRKSKENHVSRIVHYLQSNMEMAGITKIESPYFVISIRNNPESVVIDSESMIPDDYIREVPASYYPDKKLIKQAIKDGFDVPGCHLTRTQSLQIK